MSICKTFFFFFFNINKYGVQFIVGCGVIMSTFCCNILNQNQFIIFITICVNFQRTQAKTALV